MTTSAPSAAQPASFSAFAVNTSTGISRAVVRNRHRSGNSPDAVSTTRVAFRNPAGRAVSSGSSANTVFAPTITASTRPRSSCTRRRDAPPLIHLESPALVAILPSSDIAHFAMTHGRAVRSSFR